MILHLGYSSYFFYFVCQFQYHILKYVTEWHVCPTAKKSITVDMLSMNMIIYVRSRVMNTQLQDLQTHQSNEQCVAKTHH